MRISRYHCCIWHNDKVSLQFEVSFWTLKRFQTNLSSWPSWNWFWNGIFLGFDRYFDKHFWKNVRNPLGWGGAYSRYFTVLYTSFRNTFQKYVQSTNQNIIMGMGIVPFLHTVASVTNSDSHIKIWMSVTNRNFTIYTCTNTSVRNFITWLKDPTETKSKRWHLFQSFNSKNST